MRKQIGILCAVLMLCILPVFAVPQKVSGEISLIWTNVPDRPQHFEGSVLGDLEGTINLVSNTNYDEAYGTVGVTNAEVTAVLNGMDCDGFYGGANVNSGVNSGSFILVCGEQSLQGVMYGHNIGMTNMDLHYDGFLISPMPGEKGDKGDKGDQGIPGINGQNGLPGEKGDQGSPGLVGAKGDKGDKGDQGIPGINGQNGLPGEKGDQGLPGLVGAKGDKGDQGLQGLPGSDADTTTLLNTLLMYPNWDFANWYNGECGLKEIKCEENDKYTCVNYTWVKAQTCKWGCNLGVCNPQPAEDCNKMAKIVCVDGKSMTKGHIACKYGQGTTSKCNVGQCTYTSASYSCSKGCNEATGLCNK